MSKTLNLQGVPASPGIAMGRVHLYHRVRFEPTARMADGADPVEEFDRFLSARSMVRDELDRIASVASGFNDGSATGIIETHVQILDDPELRKAVEAQIRSNRKTAGTAVYDAFETYVRLLSASGNRYFQERVADLTDVRDRLIYRIQHDEREQAPLDGSILIADDLSPSEILELSKQGLSGFALQSGGATSHASIIARSLGIPGVVGCKGLMSTGVESGAEAVIDGRTGVVRFHLDAGLRADYANRMKAESDRRRQAQANAATPCVMACGTPVALRANIEFETELANLATSGAEGIGLLRTESFFMDADSGTIASQRRFYEAAVRASDPHPVTIRLFDVGGDKVTDLLTKEANPFLGWRGIRILLDRREVLREQLKAILDVAGHHPGRIRILAPMVTDPEDVHHLRDEIRIVQEDRIRTGMPVDPDVPMGIMVEVPAVALRAGDFAPYCDFFSIGTNDLTQYTLAVDRGNPMVSSYYRHHHPAIHGLIAMTVNAASHRGIPVAVCGELAADPEAAAVLVGLGIRDLSMSPAAIADVKDALMTAHCEELQAAAHRFIS